MSGAPVSRRGAVWTAESAGQPSPDSRGRRLAWRFSRGAIPVAIASVILVIAVLTSPSGNGDLLDPHSIMPEARMERLVNRIPQYGLALGRPAAGVTVTEFADLQCSACAAYALALLPQIVTHWVEPGTVKLVLQPLGFPGDGSVLAADAALAAGYQNKLWGFVYAFYYHQGPANSRYVTDAFLRNVAAGVPALNVEEMLRQSRLPTVENQLKLSIGVAVQSRVTQMPTFVIMGPRAGPFKITGTVGLEQAIDIAANT